MEGTLKRNSPGPTMSRAFSPLTVPHTFSSLERSRSEGAGQGAGSERAGRISTGAGGRTSSALGTGTVARSCWLSGSPSPVVTVESTVAERRTAESGDYGFDRNGGRKQPERVCVNVSVFYFMFVYSKVILE